MIQKPMFSPQVEWLPPTEFPDLSKYNEIAIDLETKDPNLKTMGSGSVTGRGQIVGIAVAVRDWSGYYPIRHEGGGNMDKNMVIKWFQDVLNTPAMKIFHNAMYDVCFIRAAGLKIQGSIVDTMIAGSLVDENRFRYDLGSMGRDYVGRGKNEAVLAETAKEWGIDAKSEMYKLPAIFVGGYAEQDADLTLRLYQHMRPIMEKESLLSVYKLEMDLIPIIFEMTKKGVRVDVEKAKRYKKSFKNTEKKILDSIFKDTDIAVDIWAADSVAKVFEELGGKVKYFGKPYPLVYEKSINNKSKSVLCIGDNLNTDIKGSNIQNFNSLFILNGIHKNENQNELNKLFEKYQVDVNYIQEKLKW